MGWLLSSVVGSGGAGRRRARADNEIEIRPVAIVPAKPLHANPPPEYPPNYNFALALNGATAEGGANAQLLIDGDYSHYTGGSGYAMTHWPGGQSFYVKLKKPVTIDCIRFLLWDLEHSRFYRYKLEVGADESAAKWTLISDKTAETEQCRGWQTYRFPAQTVKVIKLTGTHNSANNGFHVVELQAFLNPDLPPDNQHVPTESLDF